MEPNKPCGKHGKSPCGKCRNYAKLVVGWRREAVDNILATDGSRRDLRPVNCREIAESLIQNNCTDRGVFIAEGSEPTEKEIDQAIQTFSDWAEQEVSEADKVWSRKRDVGGINPLAIDAAKFLGLTREWSSKTTPTSDCESCGELVKKGATMCKCGWPVDWQKALDMGLLNEKLEATGRRLGKIRDAAAAEEEAEEAVLAVAEVPKSNNKGGGNRHKYGE
jgi:hypothetical protein